MKRKTLADRCVDYMREHGSINQLQATYDVGTTRLSAIIYILKERGYKIKDKWVKGKNRYGDKIEYKEYWLDE